MTEFGWAKRLGLPYFDFEASIAIGNERFCGRGTDLSETLAFEKAIAEAVERAVCAHLGISTVGVAVHTNEVGAREHSRREFIERYLFNKHRHEGAPLIEDGALLMDIEPNAALGTARFFRTVAAGSSIAIICVLTRANQRFLGLSLVTNEGRAAAAHAYLEAARNSAAFSSDSAEFLAEVKRNPDLWCCDTQLIDGLLSKSASERQRQVQLPTMIQTRLAPQELAGLGNCPAVVIRTQEEAKGA